jgi:hypothetical protein
MLFQVTDVRFDFILDDDELSPEEQLQIIEDVCSHQWEADDEDDLVEEITNATGWCILSIECDEVK